MAVTLPEKRISGTTSSRTLSDLMREREPEYEKMFQASDLEQLGHYYIAPFQRPKVWDEEQMRRLNESVHLGISIGSVVVSSEGRHDPKTNLYPRTADWIIDGQQRMHSLAAYMKHDLRIFIGTPYEHQFCELDRPQQRRFESTTIGYIRLDECTEEALREMYNRLNFGGVAHTEDQRA